MKPPKGMTLAEKTLSYWRLSKIYNGQSKEFLTVEDGLRTSEDILQNCDPARLLARVINMFQWQIINGREGEDQDEKAS